MMYRTGIILALIAAALMLAYEIGSRLSDQAIMTIAGVACGIGASIPVSVGLLIALTRDRTNYAAEEYVEPEPEPEPYNIYRPQPTQYSQMTSGQQQPQQQQPQIIVVAPPQGQMPQNYNPYSSYLQSPMNNALPAPMQERTFKIVGEDDMDD